MSTHHARLIVDSSGASRVPDVISIVELSA